MMHATLLSEIEGYLAPYGTFFSRTEARRLAARYVLGLVTQGDRKSVEPMANRVGVSKRSLQRLLTQASWDHSGMLRAYRRHMAKLCSGGEAVLVLGQTVFPKRGSHSVCVAQQYIDTFGRVLSCQTAADCVCICSNAVFPWAMNLYVPKFWARPVDPEHRLRRLKAGIPGGIRHHERWELGVWQVETAIDAGLESPSVTAEISLGRIAAFRDALDESCRRYVLEVPPETEVFTVRPVLREDELKRRGRGRPRKRRRLMSAEIPPVPISSLFGQPEVTGDGGGEESSDGKLQSLPHRVWPAEGYREGILHKPVWLARERAGPSEHGSGTRYFLSNAASGIGPQDIRRSESARRKALACKNTMTRDLGLLHHEGRSWTGWHRHVLLVFLGSAFLSEKAGTR